MLTHREQKPLVPGEPTRLAMEAMPTSMVFERGHRIRLTVRACDTGELTRFTHGEPVACSPARFAGDDTIPAVPDHPFHWLTPIISRRSPGDDPSTR